MDQAVLGSDVAGSLLDQTSEVRETSGFSSWVNLISFMRWENGGRSEFGGKINCLSWLCWFEMSTRHKWRRRVGL